MTSVTVVFNCLLVIKGFDLYMSDESLASALPLLLGQCLCFVCLLSFSLTCIDSHRVVGSSLRQQSAMRCYY